MKLAITGKGGVGKTTLASLLVWVCARGGERVIAIDANPDANLAMALGIPSEEANRIVPIAGLSDLIEERTGAKAGSAGGLFKLNPAVDDIPERFSVKKDSVSLLVMGTVKRGGAGCMCPESALLQGLLSHLVLGSKDTIIMDMDAGVEHLGRGTARGVDAFIIVVEAGRRSFETARAVDKLALDLGVDKRYLVGSKTNNEEERQFIRDNMADFEVLGFINYHPEIAEADRKGLGVYGASAEAFLEAAAIKRGLEQNLSGRGHEKNNS